MAHRAAHPGRVNRWYRGVQLAAGSAGAAVLIAGAVVVFGGFGSSGSSSPSAQATVVASPTPTAVVNATAGGIRITNGVVKTTGNDVAGLFFTVTNEGKSPDILTGVATSASKNTALFNTIVNGPVTTMPLVEQLEIPAGKSIDVTTGGYHVMIQDIANPLSPGEHVQVTLTFSAAGTLKFEVPVTGY